MNRPYHIIIYGATGYVGSLVVQYLWTHGPPTLRWAVAGRNDQKLTTLVDSLDRFQLPCKLPNILVATNSDEVLKHMTSQTRLMLNTVGTLASNAHRTVLRAWCNAAFVRGTVRRQRAAQTDS
ncbi:hypothetical protein AtubIFM55763_007112 [Aspergillus tubingensis]|uniref:Unnamed protein product n=2 Tax=Aspergillus subgen. Circumdati TaxID=2720871 RepID=A0A117DV48_ASPNG|nr:unnamed protein product [Aspergillus niger]GLA64322.1 hypothetical protein AtubIFM54640_006038 [Aspergillus tubingensis]GLA68910.1 hypothetical protein AtubIFM55763_007112 [Aspergillus tubingensis]GLA85574.1 hypothetical protein AtubIFM56815_009813 [Aspergillus tubingensis]GLA91048.1 hypothetical protein AtubIFM57143_003066 [Aspergillus tubingensis]